MWNPKLFGQQRGLGTFTGPWWAHENDAHTTKAYRNSSSQWLLLKETLVIALLQLRLDLLDRVKSDPNHDQE